MNSVAERTPEIDFQLLKSQLDAASTDSIYRVVVSAPFENGFDMVLLFLGFMCLYIVDEKTNQVRLAAASGTEQYRLSVEHMNFKEEEYSLDFDKNKDNTIVQAIISGKPQHTTDWATLNRGQTPVEAVRLNQANSGIACTALYPLSGKTRGALMYNFYQYSDNIGEAQEVFMKRYTTLVSTYLSA